MPAEVPNANRGSFRPTRWSLVARAVSADPEMARAALDEVCRDYWYPLYAFARRTGIYPDDAEDLVQGFFLHLIKEGALATADPNRGRLRTFLITVFRHHMTNEMRKRTAQKRGGGQTVISLDVEWAENRFANEPADDAPDAAGVHDRRWALLLIDKALAALAAERDPAQFESLSPFLDFASGGRASYSETAAKLGWTVNATRVAVFRLRRQFRELLLGIVADTLEEPGEEAVEAELRELMTALAG